MPKCTKNVSLEDTLASTWNTSRRKITKSTRNTLLLTLPMVSRLMVLRSFTNLSTRLFVRIPAQAPKKDFTPDKSYKRKAKISLDERKARVQAKKDAKIAELEAEDE